MNVIFDASSLINLANGGVLTDVLRLVDDSAEIGPIVEGECRSISEQLHIEVEHSALHIFDDSSISATLFLKLLAEHELGEGETECLAFALNNDDYIVCCDDRRARRVITQYLTERRVVGTLGLLALSVAKGLLTADAAFAAYEQMRKLGGFLPQLNFEAFQGLIAELR